MTLALHANLSYRLSVVGFLLGRQTAQIYARHGLAVQQWKVLSVLFHHAPMTAVEIERWVTLDKSAISRAVAQLRRAGLVERRLGLDTMETLLRQAEAAPQPQPQARTQRAHEGDAT